MLKSTFRLGQSRPLHLVLSALRPYVARVLSAAGALIVASAATLAVPLAVRRVIDFGFSSEHVGLINAYFLALFGLVAALSLASGVRFYLVTTLGERVIADLREALFARLIELDAKFFDEVKTGELTSRLGADMTQIRLVIASSMTVGVRNLLLLVGAVGMMIVSAPKLSAVVLVAIPAIVLPLAVFGRAIGRRTRAAQDMLAAAMAFAAERLSAVRLVQAFGVESSTRSKFKKAVQSSYDAARLAAALRARLTVIGIFLSFASVVTVLWLGATDVSAGGMSAGLLSQFVLYAVLGAAALGQLSEVWSEMSSGAGAAGRLADLLDLRPSIEAPAKSATLPRRVEGHIRFEGVTFAYPTGSSDVVVQNLCFEVKPGELVAVVGPSGAGKSTLLQLLLRFYDVSAGRILLDGTDIKQLRLAELRRQFAIVPQDAVIFSGSISENISFADPVSSSDRVQEAARMAGADRYISTLPKGIDTLIGERGTTLSGGQRQRLAIARAVLRDAPVLLLDEATSALDAESERLVRRALDCLAGQRTTIVIAHRLATVRKADRILVMDSGRIVAQGSHSDLMQRNGLYARLATLQLEASSEEADPAAPWLPEVSAEDDAEDAAYRRLSPDRSADGWASTARR